MVEVGGFDIPIDVPTFGVGTGSIIWIFIIFIFAMVIAITIYLIHQLRTFKYKIVVFENIAGQGYQVSFKDRGRNVKIGQGGEELLYLRKKKVYRSAYGRKMGKNTYWFAVGQDGYWYNVVLGDIDAKLGMLDIEPIDRDMRLMHVAIMKNIMDRYRKISWMDKYGSWAMGGFLILIILIGAWFLIDKIAEISSASAGSIQASERVIKAAEDLLISIDNVQGGGSGLIPADT